MYVSKAKREFVKKIAREIIELADHIDWQAAVDIIELGEEIVEIARFNEWGPKKSD